MISTGLYANKEKDMLNAGDRLNSHNGKVRQSRHWSILGDTKHSHRGVLEGTQGCLARFAKAADPTHFPLVGER
jgi:hypothetical protein